MQSQGLLWSCRRQAARCAEEAALRWGQPRPRLTVPPAPTPQVWHHSFYQVLRIAPEQHPILITDPPLNTAPNKEKVLQVRARRRGGGGLPRDQGVLCPPAFGGSAGDPGGHTKQSGLEGKGVWWGGGVDAFGCSLGRSGCRPLLRSVQKRE